MTKDIIEVHKKVTGRDLVEHSLDFERVFVQPALADLLRHEMVTDLQPGETLVLTISFEKGDQ